MDSQDPSEQSEGVEGTESPEEVEDELILKLLNDDCLFHIMSYLNLHELIVAERVCERFAAVVKRVYKSYRVLDFQLFYGFWNRHLSNPETKEIALRVGKHVHTLRAASYAFGIGPREIPSFVSTHLKGLKNIQLERFQIANEGAVRQLADVFKGVTVAKLDSCDAIDEIVMQLLKLEQLEVLELPNNRNLYGRFLQRLTNIKELSLEACSGISRQNFREFCEQHPNLRSLNIISCYWIDRLGLQSICANLKNLEKISISVDYVDVEAEDYLVLGNLPKLKHLEISSFSDNLIGVRNMNVLLMKLSTYNRLEYLDLTEKNLTVDTEKALRNFTKLKELNLSLIFNCKDSTLDSLSCDKTLQYLQIPYSDITQQGLEKLIARCSALRFIGLYGCDNIDDAFIESILEHLKGRSHMLELGVDRYKFHREEYGNFLGVNPSKLKLTFK
ncbi:F-box/LRR-repeat protein fbxl-1-like isoform X2 [Lutzomyia longipalpis]|nr:F-box/LRR-repeat protein fbxl-1-like isoform X2 [Lutzomyia longipalpis]